MMEKQQQLLAKEVFSPQMTKFRRERIIPLYKDERWSADLIDKYSIMALAMTSTYYTVNSSNRIMIKEK